MLTVSGVSWQGYVSFAESNPRPTHVHVTFHRPDGTLRAPLFGSQGGGVFVSSDGVANFEGCDIHDNAAPDVCLPSALALNFHPSPHWFADHRHVSVWQGVSFPANQPCVTFSIAPLNWPLN